MFSGILEVLHCVLVESPEALNIIKEGHIKSIISLLDKHGRNHKVCKPLINLDNGICVYVAYPYLTESKGHMVWFPLMFLSSIIGHEALHTRIYDYFFHRF